MKPIIEVEAVDKDYWRCNACGGNEGVKRIKIGVEVTEKHREAREVRLCKYCIGTLKKKLEE